MVVQFSTKEVFFPQNHVRTFVIWTTWRSKFPRMIIKTQINFKKAASLEMNLKGRKWKTQQTLPLHRAEIEN